LVKDHYSLDKKS